MMRLGVLLSLFLEPAEFLDSVNLLFSSNLDIFHYFSFFFFFFSFPCSFLETSTTYIIGYLKSHSSLMLCLFFIILFSFYIFGDFYYFIFTNIFFCNAQSAINPIYFSSHIQIFLTCRISVQMSVLFLNKNLSCLKLLSIWNTLKITAQYPCLLIQKCVSPGYFQFTDFSSHNRSYFLASL